MPLGRVFCLLIVGLVVLESGLAQQFTQVLDADNPVVHDQSESGGGSWADIDNDGYLDLFVANGNLASQNNGLYLNNRSGGFIKVTTGTIVTNGGSSIGGTFGDFNRDGNLDLFVTNRNNFGNFLFLGTGDTVFTQVTSGPPVTDIANSNMSSWVDIDNDGNLDLHVVNFQGNNLWYRNGGQPAFAFTRIDSGSIVTDGAAFSIPGLWGDMNNDRLPDFFAGKAGNENDVVHVNAGSGSFATTTLDDARGTLGASWSDYDNDGDLDLFAAHFLGQNNRLYRNGGAPLYQLIPIDTGVVSTDGGSSVGSGWGDYDNDGDLDLFVANDGQDNFLYENLGPPAYAFGKVTGVAPAAEGGNSFGAVWGDYDRDGDLDLFVANRLNQKNFLYRNSGNSNGWLLVQCIGAMSNPTAIGTKVRVRATINGQAVWQLREVTAQTGYNSQNLMLHFGLGDATTIDSIILEWPRGLREVLTGVSPDQFIVIAEGKNHSVDVAVHSGWNMVSVPIATDDNLASTLFPDASSGAFRFLPGSGYQVTDTLEKGTGYWVKFPAGQSLTHTGRYISSDTIAVAASWNLIGSLSSPVAAQSIVPVGTSVVSPVFEFAPMGYAQTDTLLPGRGYWVKVSEPGSLIIQEILLAATSHK